MPTARARPLSAPPADSPGGAERRLQRDDDK